LGYIYEAIHWKIAIHRYTAIYCIFTRGWEENKDWTNWERCILCIVRKETYRQSRLQIDLSAAKYTICATKHTVLQNFNQMLSMQITHWYMVFFLQLSSILKANNIWFSKTEPCNSDLIAKTGDRLEDISESFTIEIDTISVCLQATSA